MKGYERSICYFLVIEAMDVQLSARHAAMIARDVVLGVEVGS